MLASLNCFLTASQRLNNSLLNHIMAFARAPHTMSALDTSGSSGGGSSFGGGGSGGSASAVTGVGASELARSRLRSAVQATTAMQHTEKILSAMEHTEKILSWGTRVPGDAGWQKTLDYIYRHMLGLGWDVEKDAFVASTPVGKKPMVNVVASLNARGGVCLVDLAAHFESKYFADLK
jgi:hypothetical protein